MTGGCCCNTCTAGSATPTAWRERSDTFAAASWSRNTRMPGCHPASHMAAAVKVGPAVKMGEKTLPTPRLWPRQSYLFLLCRWHLQLPQQQGQVQPQQLVGHLLPRSLGAEGTRPERHKGPRGGGHQRQRLGGWGAGGDGQQGARGVNARGRVPAAGMGIGGKREAAAARAYNMVHACIAVQPLHWRAWRVCVAHIPVKGGGPDGLEC